MEQWMTFVLIAGLILAIYVLYFFLSSMVRRGSLIRIKISYVVRTSLARMKNLFSRSQTEAGPTSLYPKDLPPPPPDPKPPKPAPAAAPQPARPVKRAVKPQSGKGVSKASATDRAPTVSLLSRLTGFLTSPKAEAEPVGLSPNHLEPPVVVQPARPVQATPPSRSYKSAMQREAGRAAAHMTAMTDPSSEPFPVETARQAMHERQRVWVKYKDDHNREAVEKVEIYKVTLGGHLRAWFAFKRKRGTLRRNRILSWRLLDERFEHSAYMEQWARWAGLRSLLGKGE